MSPEDNFFQKIFQEKQVISKKRLDNYLKVQGENQIHDLRTSIRRLEATYLIIPNSCKKKKTNDFVSSYKSLFRKNSSVRDLDVILGKLLKNGLEEDSDIIKYLDTQKNKKLRNILKDAKKLTKLKVSSIKKTSNKKMIKKYEKIIFSLITKIQYNLPIVTSDESKIKELHSMRKTAKKLRYVLEIDPNDSYRSILEKIKSFQEFLGKIHDCDITINFLEKQSKKIPNLEPIILKEQKIRSQIYQNLANSLSEKL